MNREVIGNIELTREDCMELMARYPDKYFDLNAKNKQGGKR